MHIALLYTPWCLSEAVSVHLFGQMGCKSSPLLDTLLDTHSASQTGCFLFDYSWCKLSTAVLVAVKLGSKWQSLSQRTFSPDFFVVWRWGNGLLMHKLFRHVGNTEVLLSCFLCSIYCIIVPCWWVHHQLLSCFCAFLTDTALCAYFEIISYL